MRVNVRMAVRYALGALCPVFTSSVVMAQAAGPEPATVGALEEIVVTAQRRVEKLQDVPISVTAFNQEQMDAQGVRSVDDIARLTPGITFQRTDNRNTAASSIAIRGIASSVGASTTGIYIDDTPVQIRAIGAGLAGFIPYPQIFDLDRVEVLRGPQGTLFGAGSEGGTVRFITPQPSLAKTSGYFRSELSYTQGADPSYEAGAAFGAPLVDEKVAFRVSAWFRRDGGWVDRDAWDHTSSAAPPAAVVAPTPASVTTTLDPASNWENSAVVKAALLIAPSDGLTLTPSIYYQRNEVNDVGVFWSVLSQPSQGSFINGNAQNAPSNDRFYLPALKAEWAFGSVALVSNTSYFNRYNNARNDYTSFEASIWALNPFYPAGYPPASALQTTRQNNFTQELRLQSTDPAARISWVTGLFYSHARQTATQIVEDTGLPALFFQNTGVPFDVALGPLVDGKYTYVENPTITRDTQTAAYGQADVKLTDGLTFTAGLRLSDTKFQFTQHYEGPVVGPVPVNNSGSKQQTPVTPKSGLSYKFDPDNMVYATAAKGFRIGGANSLPGTPCNNDPGRPGYTPTYGSDSVWSYEVGSKNSLLEHRLRLDTSIYHIDWKDIQQGVNLNTCGFAYVANLGKATSNGVDFQADFALTRDLILGLAAGYDDAKLTKTVPVAGSTVNLVSDGDHLVGWPWTLALSAQYNFVVVAGKDSYLRVDYQHQGEQSQMTARTDPQDSGYNPHDAFHLPTTNQLSARMGTRWEGFDISAFCNNVTNSHTIIAQTMTPAAAPTYYYQYSTFRPRTFGLTAAYRF